MSGTTTTPAVPLDPALRVAAGAAGAAAIWAAGSSGALDPVSAGLLLVVQVAVTLTGVLTATPRRFRQVASWAVLALAVVAAARAGDLAGGTSLAVLAGGLVVSQNLLLERARDVGVCLVTVAGTTVLVLSREPSPAALPAVAVAWVAGVVTVALLRRPVVAATGPAPEPLVVLRRLVWPVAASLVAAAVVGLLGVTPPSTAPDRRSAGLGGLDGSSAGSTGPERGSADDQAFAMDMRQRGPLPDWPVMEVPSSSDRLWRTGVLAGYDGSSWYPFASTPLPTTPHDPLGLGDVDPAAGDRTSALRTDRVTVLEGMTSVLAVPGHAVALRADVPVRRATSRGQLPADAWAATTYEVDSYAVPDASSAPAVPGSDPDEPVWTALPDTVTDRTRTLARAVAAGAGTRAEVVAAVEEHLRSTYAYDLDSPVPPDGQDSVDHFLFEAQVGFCQQFAAAEVVLLRSLGVPARVAVGYSGGRDADGRRTVTADRSHAWVEVWQPGTGWTPSDPTPAASAPGPAERLADWFADPGHRRLLAGVLVALFGLAAGLALVVRGRARPEPAPLAVPDPLLDAVERLLPALERAGRPSAPHETVAALARREPELAGALAVAEVAAYGPRAPRWREAADARDRLEAFAARLRAEADPGTGGRRS